MRKFGSCLIFLCIAACRVAAQDISIPEIIIPKLTEPAVPKLNVAEIKIIGNKKTKPYIIKREIQFQVGDSLRLDQFDNELHTARDQVYNLNLFTEVFIEPTQIIGSDVYITVRVLERWYIYPTPQFQLVDRNFNEWIKVYNASLDRVNYGAKFVHYNLSGRKDELRLQFINGYSRNVTLSYVAPYSNANLNRGYALGTSFNKNKEAYYKTSYNNKQLSYNRGNFVSSTFAAGGSYIIRKGFYDRRSLAFTFTHTSVSDSITTSLYNPNYFNTGKSDVGFTDLSYSYRFLHTNNNNYPLKGEYYHYKISKRGLGWRGGINKLELEAGGAKYVPHRNNWFSNFSVAGLIKLPFKQPYYNQNALGYNNFNLRGLEYYVIDGVAAALGQYTIKKKVVEFDLPMPFKIKSIPKIPIKLYAKSYTDIGYCYNDPNLKTRLNNVFLYSGGVGLDILSIYDSNFALDYSFNQLGEKGLFLSFRLGF